MTGVRYDVDDAVATITLDSPETRNRLDLDGMQTLSRHLASAGSDPDVRVVVLTGSGTTFCAGADLSSALAQDEQAFTGSGPQALVDVLTAMLGHPKPIIGRIQGHVAGGGNGLVAACDVAVAAQDARFAFSEVRVGVAPSVISVVCLQVMNRRAAQQLFLTGERVDAETALRAGLLTSVVPVEALDDSVAAIVRSLQLGGPLALARTKELLRRVPALPGAEQFDLAAALSAELFASDEAREGMSAYLEKRPPRWAPSD